jgi:hypothetical protein
MNAVVLFNEVHDLVMEGFFVEVIKSAAHLSLVLVK